jgi:hypothetical protein
MRHLVVALAVVASVSAVHAAPDNPQPPTGEQALAQARTYYAAGRDAFDGGKYVLAIDALEQALTLAPTRASVRFALGKAYRFQFIVDSDPAKAHRAVELLRQFLDQQKEGEERQEAVRFVAELGPVADKYAADRAAANEPPPPPPKPKTELMVVSKPSGAHATIDGGPAASTPAVQEVTTGKHAVHVDLEGFLPEDTEGVAVDGRMVAVEVALRERPATIKLDAPAGATVSVDGRPVGVAPLAPLQVASGAHFVAVTERGHAPWTRDLRLARGETTSLHAELHQTGQRRAAYFLAAGAGALLAGGVIATAYAADAKSSADAITTARGGGNISQSQLDQQNQDVDDYHTDTTISRVLYGGALALIATGVVLYIADQPRVEAPQQPSTLITPAPVSGGGLSLTLTRRF